MAEAKKLFLKRSTLQGVVNYLDERYPGIKEVFKVEEDRIRVGKHIEMFMRVDKTIAEAVPMGPETKPPNIVKSVIANKPKPPPTMKQQPPITKPTSVAQKGPEETEKLITAAVVAGAKQAGKPIAPNKIAQATKEIAQFNSI